MPTLKSTKAIAAAAAVTALLSLSLAGCSSSSNSSQGCTSSVSSGSVSDSIKATGAVGKAPKVTFSKGLSTKTTQKTTLVQGKGKVITKGDPVVFQVSLYDGKTGAKATATDYSGSGTYLVAGPSANLSALSRSLVCSHVGDRIAIAGSAKDSTNGKGISDYKIGATDSVVFVADILKAFPGRATGKKQTPVKGEPTVTLAKDGAPTITIPKGVAAPTKLTSTTLIKGSGATVKAGDTLMMQYTGALYKDGTVFDSSWKRGQPFVGSLTQGQLITGWVQGLAGKTVGSQVLLVVPPADGYGTQAQTGIPANSTLVFVVDILGRVG